LIKQPNIDGFLATGNARNQVFIPLKENEAQKLVCNGFVWPWNTVHFPFEMTSSGNLTD